MKLVVDASVAVKWVVAEERSDSAHAVLRTDLPILAPDLVVPEVANTLWKKVRRDEVKVEHARRILAVLPSFFDRLWPVEELTAEAFELAQALDHPVYDCYYLALADHEGAAFVTDDSRLTRKLASGGWQGEVRPLASFIVPPDR